MENNNEKKREGDYYVLDKSFPPSIDIKMFEIDKNEMISNNFSPHKVQKNKECDNCLILSKKVEYLKKE